MNLYRSHNRASAYSLHSVGRTGFSKSSRGLVVIIVGGVRVVAASVFVYS